MAAGVPEIAHDLYAVPPDAFIEARNDLARRLRDEGDADTATVVGKLRKPTVAAAVVNAAARAHGALVDELLAAGTSLAAAQRKLLSKKPGAADEMRAAGDARRRAIRALADAALADAERAGRSVAHLRDEVAGTFEAATLDDELGERVRTGTVEKTVVPSAGIAGVEGFAVIPGGAEPSAGDVGGTDQGERASRAADDAVEAARVARAEADAAVAAAERAGAEADRLAGLAEEAERASRAARAEERRLRDEASTARRRADRAERAARAAADRASRSRR